LSQNHFNYRASSRPADKWPTAIGQIECWEGVTRDPRHVLAMGAMGANKV